MHFREILQSAVRNIRLNTRPKDAAIKPLEEKTMEVLGPWFVSDVALVAFAAAIGTTSALRWLVRKTP
jgi:hypothetical protein